MGGRQADMEEEGLTVWAMSRRGLDTDNQGQVAVGSDSPSPLGEETECRAKDRRTGRPKA